MAADGSTPIPRDVAPEAALPATLADVLARLEDDRDLDPARRRELCSAVRSVCRACKADPASAAANPRQLRARLRGVTAAAAGVGRGRWSNIRSLILKALKRVGIKAMPGRYRKPHAPAWEALRSRLPDRRFGSGLSRFMSYATAHGIEPEEVTPGTFERFQIDLEASSLARDPGGIYRDTCKLWNEAARSVSGWPALQVEVPVRRRDFALPLSAFPEPFREDVDRFLSERADPDVFSESYCKPASPTTLRNRRRNILMAATALASSGFPISEITGLSVVTDSCQAKRALRLLYDRAGGKTSGHLHQIATLLKTIARHYVKAGDDAIELLRRQCRRLKPPSSGLTEKNKTFLRQFADLDKLGALLTLPQRLVARAERRAGNRRREAVSVELAVAIAIELAIPIRADNLTGLRLDRHIHRAGKKALLSIPAEETKNENAIEAELPHWVVRLLDLYLKHYRPRLLTGPAPWLFPGENGSKRRPGGFSAQISALIAKEAGITMTLHQFRHLAAKLYLDRNPDGFETVRRLLGHKSLITTMRFYREFESLLANRRYAEFVEELVVASQRETVPKPLS